MSYRLFSEAKNRASEFLGSEVGLDGYIEKFASSIPKHPQKKLSTACIADQIAATDIILVGDFHTLEKSQTGFLELIESYSKKSEAVIALEIFKAEDQILPKPGLPDSAIEGKIAKVQQDQTWDFSKRGYGRILEYCRDHTVPVEGISPQKRSKLANTDIAFAQSLLKLRVKYPNKKIFVLVGESHLAPEHLPAQIKKNQHKSTIPFLKTKVLSVLQNVDSFYFWHIHQGKNPFDTFAIDSNTIAISQVPPHLKWDSVIQYHSLDKGEQEADYLEKETEEAWDFATHFLKHFKISYLRETLAGLQILIGSKGVRPQKGQTLASLNRELLRLGFSWLPNQKTLILLKNEGNTRAIATAFILLSKSKPASKKRFQSLYERFQSIL